MPYPLTGNQRKLIAKMMMSRYPIRNAGIPSPTSGTARTTWSRMPSFLVAASIDSGTLISTAMMAA